LNSNDCGLSVADFLDYGNPGIGVLELDEKAGIAIVKMGCIIEKAFQHGRV
jgi:xanthine phosphoribosyltransferase